MTIYKSVGVTATRLGLTLPQKEWALGFFETNEINVLHHGDCKGGDDQLARMAHSFDIYIIAHPGDSAYYRAYCEANDLVLPEKENLVRNRNIVAHCQLLLAFPQSKTPLRRSGTWYTIRHTQKMPVHRRPQVITVLPDGSVRNNSILRLVTDEKTNIPK